MPEAKPGRPGGLHDQAREIAREHIRRAARAAGDPQSDIEAMAGIRAVARGQCTCGREKVALFPLSDAHGTRYLCMNCIRENLFSVEG